MGEFELFIFNVERGLCVFARTPNDYGVMIDCGCCAGVFSPAEWLYREVAPSLRPWNGHALTKLIVTHPHDDHVEDIDTVRQLLPPALLQRQKNFDWRVVLNPPDGDPSPNAKAYYAWQQAYSVTARTVPDYGLKIQTFRLSPTAALALDPTPQHLLNNSSIVTVFTWQVAPDASWKVVVSGDNETAGWRALLQRRDFQMAINGAHFFVSSHHGHASGFCADLFQVMGRPLAVISSERAGDQSVFNYSPYARGVPVNGNSRSHLTTRRDGHIVVGMQRDLRFTIDTYA